MVGYLKIGWKFLRCRPVWYYNPCNIQIIMFLPGSKIECPKNHVMTSSCGSGRLRDCPHGKGYVTFAVSCCALGKEYRVTQDCHWNYAQFGYDSQCHQRSQVVTGMCGSLNQPMCTSPTSGNRFSHAIQCCKIQSTKSRPRRYWIKKMTFLNDDSFIYLK